MAQDNYKTPPQALADLVDAPRTPSSIMSPDKLWLGILQRPGAPSIDELAQPEAKLAGLKLNPKIFASSRSSGYLGIELRSLSGDKKITLENLPEGKIQSVSFSPDSQHLAFVLEDKKGLTLWAYTLASQRLWQVSDRYINSTLGGRYRWRGDSKGFYTTLTVAQASEAPQEESVEIQPVIQTTDGKKAAVRTYSNLLASPYDEALFEFLVTAQLAYIDLSGKVQLLGKPGMYDGYGPSPDGQYLLVSEINKPFSYLVPVYRFPRSVHVWDTQGQLVTTVASLPSGENIPKGFDSVIDGRRSIEWRSDTAATLIWAEALDGGDMSKEMDYHDAVYQWSAPFEEKPQELFKTERRFSGIYWGTKDLALAYDWRFSDRQLRGWKFNPSDPAAPTQMFEERSYNDRYNDPGNFVNQRNEFGRWVIKVIDDTKIQLNGIGASPKGNIPFLDEYDFATDEKQRLWESKAPYYERVVSLLNEDGAKLLILRESRTERPNYFIQELTEDSLTQFTFYPHPSPGFKDVQKELITYQREDGVELTGTLYLPVGYDKSQGPLPLLMWAYPQEYKDKDVAGQVTESPYEFVWVSYWGPMPHLAQGFAVFDDPKMPIVGQGKTLPNDNFRKQLVMSAEAAINVLVDKGIADPKRVAIAGHSYGAFMVANLLAHSDLFKAGIARSGAYNRSLTPFGFQGEERSFWEGQLVYADMSPFFHAEKINEPILMIHGKEDPNSGTFPMQSERMFAALKGLGGNSRLVMLPHEQHGYRARESLLHMLWEQHQWLEKHVKNVPGEERLE
ncbi:MAG: prolyl oligopeptidase family serine peptidase [Pseudomonadota bacterium]